MKTAQNTPLEKADRIIQGMIDEAVGANVSAPRFRATLKHLWVVKRWVSHEGNADWEYKGRGKAKAVIEFSTLKEFHANFKEWYPEIGNDLLEEGWDSDHSDLVVVYLGDSDLTRLTRKDKRDWENGEICGYSYSFVFKVERITKPETLDEQMEKIFGTI